ncbi:MAG: hypothetical protein Q7T51_00720 [Candidatus Moranbacteria bacterium]|nr:hypothetical protein [Candidatus Moranbacteria bacterium]
MSSAVIPYGISFEEFSGHLNRVENATTIEEVNEVLGLALVCLEESDQKGVLYEQINEVRRYSRSIIEKIEKNPVSVSQLERRDALIEIKTLVLHNPNGTPAFPLLPFMEIWFAVSFVVTAFGWGIILHPN